MALQMKIKGEKFPLGQIVATPGAHSAINQEQAFVMIAQHATGDWGAVCEEDKGANDDAIKYGNRILSAYPIDPSKPCAGYGENCIWIITEADRSVTTILLPDEY